MAFWVWIAATTLSPFAAFAYAGHDRANLAYDSGCESAIGYGAVLAHAADEKQNGTTQRCVCFAKFAGFVAAKGGALTKVANFANNRLAAEHYAKHVKGVIDKGSVQKVSPFGADMPEFTSFKNYVQAARKFNSGPTPSGVLEGVRANGDILRFDPATGNFGIRTPQGTIRTFFRPSERVDYFYKQFK